MFNVSVKVDTKAIERKMIEAAEKQLLEKLRRKGISNVRVKAAQKMGKPIFEFSGPKEEVEKARELFGKKL